MLDDDHKSKYRSDSFLSSATSHRSENKKEVVHVYQDRCAITDASIFSRFFFTWS
jgi:hypothetical protein